MDMTGIPSCPICKREMTTGNVDPAFRPFCSARCKTIDLGGWLGGTYRIGQALADEDDDGSPAGQPPTEPDDGRNGG
jgi:endogenous inhibitor of DNA gyrase (YacG/DUF329 family)